MSNQEEKKVMKYIVYILTYSYVRIGMSVRLKDFQDYHAILFFSSLSQSLSFSSSPHLSLFLFLISSNSFFLIFFLLPSPSLSPSPSPLNLILPFFLCHYFIQLPSCFYSIPSLLIRSLYIAFNDDIALPSSLIY